MAMELTNKAKKNFTPKKYRNQPIRGVDAMTVSDEIKNCIVRMQRTTRRALQRKKDRYSRLCQFDDLTCGLTVRKQPIQHNHIKRNDSWESYKNTHCHELGRLYLHKQVSTPFMCKKKVRYRKWKLKARFAFELLKHQHEEPVRHVQRARIEIITDQDGWMSDYL